MSFVRYLWGPAGPESQPEAGNELKDKREACKNDKQIVATHQFQRPLDFVRWVCHHP